MSNQIQSFLLEKRHVRGAVLHLRSGVAELVDSRDYAADVRTLVVQALAAAPLLATHLKGQARINLQFEGKDDLTLLVAQVDQNLQVRAMAQAKPDASGGFSELTANGNLALMLEPEKGPAYQAFVPTEGETLAQALEGYFVQSEQLPTRIRIAEQGDALSAILLQRMPTLDDEGYWEQASFLFDTISNDELLQLDAAELLHRLFHDEECRVYEPRQVDVRCRCSHACVSALILSLGKEEADDIVAEQGKIGITCEFCGQEYLYMPPEVNELFAAQQAEPDPGTLSH